MADPERQDFESGTEIERTIFFSDPVFAIAITLLVMNLQIPQIPDNLVGTELSQKLLELWPKLLSFFISFWIVGFFWIGHHRTFHYIKGYDRKLLMLNLWFLLWVALMPFSASLLGRYGGEQISVIIYATHMIVAGLFLSSLWWYASRDPRLMDRDIDPQVRRYNQFRALTVPSVFLISIAVSFVNVNAAEYCWLLFLVRLVLLRYVERDSRSQT